MQEGPRSRSALAYAAGPSPAPRLQKHSLALQSLPTSAGGWSRVRPRERSAQRWQTWRYQNPGSTRRSILEGLGDLGIRGVYRDRRAYLAYGLEDFGV